MFQRRIHVGELSFPTRIGNFDRVQHGAQARNFPKRTISVPPFGASQKHRLGFLKIDYISVFSDVGEIEDFGVVGVPFIGFWKYFEFAERVTKFD